MSRMFALFAEALIAIASLALLILAMVIAVDVVFRNAGIFYIPAVVDYMTIAQIVLTSCAIPAAFINGSHLIVEIGTYRFSERNKSRLESVWLFLAVPVFAFLSKLVLAEGLHMHAQGRTVGVLGWSPNLYHFPVSAALFAAGALCLIIGISKARGRLKFI